MSYNLNENLIRSASNFPESIAYIYGDKSVTYQELNQKVDQLAAGLYVQGIRKGDGVALILGNSPEFLIAYYGILRLGAFVVPINPFYTQGEIKYLLDNCQAKAVITHVSVKPKLSEVKKQLENLKLVVYIEAEDQESTWERLMETSTSINACGSPYIDDEDLAVILYTSGTTGKPKGAMLTHRNLVSNADSISKLLEFDDKDRVVAVLPMFHVFCMTVCLNAPIACGATVLIQPKFSPHDVVSTIREKRQPCLLEYQRCTVLSINCLKRLRRIANLFACVSLEVPRFRQSCCINLKTSLMFLSWKDMGFRKLLL